MTLYSIRRGDPTLPSLGHELTHKVPLFFGLKPRDIKLFMEICKATACPVDEVICEYGTASRRFYILLEGSLKIVGPDGTTLAQVRPVTTVGEMGFVNRKPRSATVITAEPSRLFPIEHHDFESLLERHVDLRIKIYRNMIRVLSDRLNDANDMLTRYKKVYGAGGERAVADEAPPTGSTVDESGAIREDTAEEADDGRAHGSASDVDEASTSPDDDDGVPEPPVDVSGQSSDQESAIVNLFYELIHETPQEDHLEQDLDQYTDLKNDGYTDADIEFAVKWAARNITSAKRFIMVKLSVEEAFEERWNL